MRPRHFLLALVTALSASFLTTPAGIAAPQAKPGDLAWTTEGDATGFHLLVADSATGYGWRTAATLSEPWIETDRWVGNACLTGSGKHAVVVYAPRHFTNRAHLFDRGAFAAVVDLGSGAVTKLPVTVSLAYYNPGCGAGETAVLTQSGFVDRGRTRLHVVDTETGELVRVHELPGEVTSAVPVGEDGGDIVAAHGSRLVEVDRSGKERLLAGTTTVPFRVHPDADGGVVFMERRDETALVRRMTGGTVTDLGRGPLIDVNVLPGTAGRVFVTGSVQRSGQLPSAVTVVDAPADAEVSTAGRLSLTRSGPAPGLESLHASHTANGAVQPLTFAPAPPPSALGPAPSPAVTSTESAAARPLAESPTNPVDQDRMCSIPRNDARIQVYQPHWSQVEWAADLAVQGGLTVQRPANWKQSGMPSAWQPQQMFPPIALTGGGRVPAPILLGVLAQESNLWQASFHVVEGVTGNPLIGNYYGLEDGWGINWTDADCGYGVSQMTDGMRMAGRTKPGEVALAPEKQRAVAVDYATNIAAGLRVLQQKWNQTRALGMTVNGGDSTRIETWFAALWAYNSGLNPQASTGNTTGCTPGPSCTDAPGNGPGGNYGLGWSNNPARPDYPANRTPFLDGDSYDDARHPQDWPYPEKVIGWAAYPIVKYTGGDGYEAGYKQAWWTGIDHRTRAKPPLPTFCAPSQTTGNLCNPANISTQFNPCTRADAHCWWHVAAEWKFCSNGSTSCGYESEGLATPGTPEPPDADAAGAYTDEQRSRYRPNCSTGGLPSGALVIDDQPSDVPVVRSGCSRTWSNQGTFGLQFAQHSDGLYHSKVDFHQIGGGFGGHFWFTHARTGAADLSKNWRVTGTWTLNRTLNQWARVLVHMPDHGAHAQQASYLVHLGNGQTRSRAVLQNTQQHNWVSLGVFQFAGTPKVSLTNITSNGDGTEDVAYDAVAFQPLTAKPTEQIVMLGDSYTSGEGASVDAAVDYYQETDDSGFGGTAYRNGCHRSRNAWSRQMVLPGTTESVGARADRWDPSMDYHLLACSGARTNNLLPGQPGQHRELAQLDRGFLDENTTTVGITIGGNDAHFSDVMKICTLGTPTLTQDCRHSRPDWDPTVLVSLEQYLPGLITGQVRTSVENVLRRVVSKAPNARLVVSGYPRLFPPQAPGVRFTDCDFYPAIVPPEMNWLNHMSDLMNQTIHEVVVTMAAEGLPVLYSDPRDEFELENACVLPQSNEKIHRVVLGRTEGEEQGIGASQQSFHPTIAGQRNYGDAFTSTLRTTQTSAGMPIPVSRAVAKAELEELKTYGRHSGTTYDRTLFQHWVRVAGICDARDIVLRRDGTNLVSGTGCTVAGGRWTSPYENATYTDPGLMTIDHVVPLKDAWISGAAIWTPSLRRTFANDIEHPQLLSVSKGINSSKADRPPDVWLPATSYLCTYARAWIQTKSMYRMSVSQAEYDTLTEILDTRC